MKKIVTVFMCLMLFLLLVSCAGNNTGTTTESSTAQSNPTDVSQPSTLESSPDSESSSTESSTVNSTNDSLQDTTDSSKPDTEESKTTPSSRPLPQITEDLTRYNVTVLGQGEQKSIRYLNEQFYFPSITSYYNGYSTALTMTFDDGYDVNTGVVVSDLFERYGYRGTMMIGPCFLNNQSLIDGWNKVFARGYLDLGCHGYNHKEPSELPRSEYEHEIKDAIMFLREKFPGQRVLTYATPFAHYHKEYQNYLSQFVIGNRLEAGGGFLNPKKEYDPYSIKAISINRSSPAGNGLYKTIDNCIKYENWMVELFHCVIDGATNSTDVDKGAFETHCEYLYRNYRDKLWFATFEEVLVYAEEVKHLSIEYTACDRESMTFRVDYSGELDKELYNIPVSMKVFLPSRYSDSAYAIVNGEKQYLKVEVDFDSGFKYAIVKDIPPTSTSEVKIILGGNKNMANGCAHFYTATEQFEATHDEMGYTVYTCQRCNHSYNAKYTDVAHDFTGEEVAVIEPTERKSGLTKFYCTQCDKYEVKEIGKLTN